MAIDTEDKRRSALLGTALPVPDGSINFGDRKHALWLYRGITISILSGPFGVDESQAYVQGQQEGQSYLGGQAESQRYLAGQQESQAQPS